jgi:lincosamide and streptogramin A transport system ATP-binding/permease protein
MTIINVKNLTFAYEGSYENIFENISFQLDTDWKLGLIGRNGRGKTTFLNLLQGKYAYAGEISATVGFEYFPYEVAQCHRLTQDVIARICRDHHEWELIRELNLLEVEADVLSRPFYTLSQGEQTKVLLAALFLKKNRFFLIDEPTNHLDIAGRQLVGDYLNGKKGFILTSQDRNFLDHCTDHILAFNKAAIEIQKGNFSSWWANKERQDAFELAESIKLKKEIRSLSLAAKHADAWSDKVEKTKYGTLNSGLKPDKGYIGSKSAKMMKRAKMLETRQEKAAAEKSLLLRNKENIRSLKLIPGIYHSRLLAELRDVVICYGDKPVGKPVSFTIERGDRTALWGKNGSGKSSLLKLIGGSALDYQGTLRRGNRLQISHVPQDSSFLQGKLAIMQQRTTSITVYLSPCSAN